MRMKMKILRKKALRKRSKERTSKREGSLWKLALLLSKKSVLFMLERESFIWLPSLHEVISSVL